MIEWRNFLTTVSAAALIGILSVAWLSYNKLQELTWQAPLVMSEIAIIKADIKDVKKDIDRIERTVRIEKDSDKVVKLIERD